MTLRISATLLESFRRYLVEDNVTDKDGNVTIDWEHELQAHIRGEFVTSDIIEIGKAFHALLEKPQLNLSGVYESKGYRFTRYAIESMLDKVDSRGVFEVKLTKEIGVPLYGHNIPVRLVAKCDHLAGLHLSEFKTTFTTFDPEKYLNSMQWKVMTFLFEPKIVTYHVALLDCDRDTGTFGLRSVESMNCYPYPELEEDVRETVRLLVDYVDKKGLTEFLTEKEAVAR